MGMRRVRVRRERPAALSWAIALAVTMLAVYVLTIGASVRPDAVESVAAMPRVTRELELAELEMYCVSLGHWSDDGRARMEAAGYVSRGAAGCVYAVDGAWHVLGAMYEQPRDAKRAASQLTADGAAQASVIPLKAERVRLRVTAPENQIEAISALDACLRAQIKQLGTAARQLDRGEIEPDAARTLCALASTEAEDAAKRLAGFPGASESPLCNALVAGAQNLAGQLDAVANSPQNSPTALSGMMRLAQIDAFLALRSLQAGLLDGERGTAARAAALNAC